MESVTSLYHSITQLSQSGTTVEKIYPGWEVATRTHFSPTVHILVEMLKVLFNYICCCVAFFLILT